MSQLEEYCQKIGFELEVEEFKRPTHTAAEAAEALKCDINQIGKSLLFNNLTTGKPLLIIMAGGSRVNEAKVKAIKGWEIEKMEPEDVVKITGFPVGGVAPFGHKKKIQVLIDQDLYNFQYIWVAAGKVNAVFKIRVGKLAQLAEAEIVNLR